MSNLQKNPFKFGDPVEGENFFPQPEIEALVSQFLINRIPVVLIGPRRFGKTSFLLHLLHHLNRHSYSYLFVDIFNITSHKDFLHQLLRAIKAKKNWKDSLLDFFRSIPKFRPKISTHLDSQTGKPSFDFTIDMAASSEIEVKEMIQDLLTGLSGCGDRLILAIDEFQKIAEINDDGWLEATLRTHMQQLKNTSFIFTGSRRGIIYDMLNNSSRPLYRFCQPIEFPIFGDAFTDWILMKFKEVRIKADREAIEHLRRIVQNTPNYVQMICFHLVALGKKTVNVDEVNQVLKTVVKQNGYAYQTLLNTLTPVQQRVLRLAAKEESHIFEKEKLQKYEIASGAALASAIRALKDKEILDEENVKGVINFDDPLFAIWLKNF